LKREGDGFPAIMKFISTKIKDVFIIEPKVYEDDRGFFMETFRANLLAENGINYQFVQDNYSGSKLLLVLLTAIMF